MALDKMSLKVFFPMISLWELKTTGTWPIWTPGTWSAGFTKETTRHCYILNTVNKLWDSWFQRKRFFQSVSHYKSMKTLDPLAGSDWTPGAWLPGFM